MLSTIVASDDLALAGRRLAARVAQDRLAFVVPRLEQIQRLIVSSSTSIVHSQKSLGLVWGGVRRLPGLCIGGLCKLAIFTSCYSIKVFSDVRR